MCCGIAGCLLRVMRAIRARAASAAAGWAVNSSASGLTASDALTDDWATNDAANTQLVLL